MVDAIEQKQTESLAARIVDKSYEWVARRG